MGILHTQKKHTNIIVARGLGKTFAKPEGNDNVCMAPECCVPFVKCF